MAFEIFEAVGGGFNTFYFSPRSLEKISNLTCAYFSDGLVKNHQSVLIHLEYISLNYSWIFFSLQVAQLGNGNRISRSPIQDWELRANFLGLFFDVCPFCVLFFIFFG